MARLAFVVPERPDPEGVELAESLARACTAAGHPAVVCAGGEGAGAVPVMLTPADHERWDAEAEQAAAGALVLCTAAPGTRAYETVVRHHAATAGVLAADLSTVRALRGMGANVRLLPPAPPADLEPVEPDVPRDLDVVVIDAATSRRAQVLAGAAEPLSRWRCELRLVDERDPHVDRRRLLARARLTILVHPAQGRAFRWFRALEAMQLGCAVLTERASDSRPLRAGRELLSAAPASIGLMVQSLLEDEPRRQALAARGAEAAARLDGVAPVRTLVELAARATPLRRAAPRAPTGPDGSGDVPPPRDAVEDDPLLAIRRRERKRQALAALRRRRAVALARAPNTDTRVVLRSVAWEGFDPEVSVVVSLYDHGPYVVESLDSVAVSDPVRAELVVVDDGSGDDSAAVVEAWMRARSDVPATLLAHPVNRGLAAARNTAIASARAPSVFVLDSDNAVFPGALATLARRLRDDAAASFAYGILEMFEPGRAIGMRSAHEWQPRRLRERNPVDAMAMIRTSVLHALGGYTSDERLHGWEDYDLWCAMAERGLAGAFVPEFLGRYRVAGTSMLSLTDLSFADAYEALIERHPRLMAGVRAPAPAAAL